MRRATITLPYEELANAAAGRASFYASGVPEDAELVETRPDVTRQTLTFVLEHPSFPDTPPGAELPSIPSLFCILERLMDPVGTRARREAEHQQIAEAAVPPGGVLRRQRLQADGSWVEVME